MGYFLKLWPYWHQKKMLEISSKVLRALMDKWEDREVAYRLDLPPEAIIHNVFHVSQLPMESNQIQHQHPTLMEEFELQALVEQCWECVGIDLGANEWLVKMERTSRGWSNLGISVLDEPPILLMWKKKRKTNLGGWIQRPNVYFPVNHVQWG